MLHLSLLNHLQSMSFCGMLGINDIDLFPFSDDPVIYCFFNYYVFNFLLIKALMTIETPHLTPSTGFCPPLT